MKKQLSAIFILSLLAFFIFSFILPKQGKVNPVSDIISSKIFHKPIIDKQFFSAITEIVPVDSAFVSKDTLNIITRKIAGCDAANFKLVWNGAMSKSVPPQTTVRLFKAADTDCSEKHKFHLIFNITPLRLKQDSTANRTTIVSLGGYKMPLKYEFDSLPRHQHHKN
jgi:hypothetical protein